MRRNDTTALMKCPMGNNVPPGVVKWSAEKSGLPTNAAIRGVSRSVVSAVTTPPKAAPITTPTAISTTFPRRMNFLKPLSIRDLREERAGKCTAADSGGQGARAQRGGVARADNRWRLSLQKKQLRLYPGSDPHG